MAVIPLTLGDVSGTGHGAAWAKVAVAHAVEAVDAETDIVELTNGPAPPASVLDEQSRLLPVLEGLLMARPGAVVAVDAHYAETARAAIKAGAEIVNDISGLGRNGPGWNEAVAEVVAQSGCGLVLRHTRSCEALADGPMSKEEVIPNTFGGLCERMMLAEAARIDPEQIVTDPGFGLGFGFGKLDPRHEGFALLAGLGRLRQIGRPLLFGIHPPRDGRGPRSRRLPDESPQTVATVAAHVTAILAGAHLLRVHDVRAAKEAAVIADAVLEAGASSS